MEKLNRKTIRNMLRNVYGNDNVRNKFNQLQVEKYGSFKLRLIHLYNQKHKPYMKTLKQRGISV